MRVKLVLALIALCLLPAVARAQDRKVIYTATGEKFTGTVLRQDDKFIDISLEGGQARIPTSIVKKIADLVTQAKLQLLVIHDRKLADRLHEELRYGADLTELVKKHSQHITFFNDGKTDFVDKSYLPEKVADTAFKLSRNAYTRPLQDGDAFYIIKILDKREVEKEPPKPEENGKPQEGQGTAEVPDKPQETQKPLIKIAVLPLKETTREAKAACTGAKVEVMLVSELSKTTGLDAFVIAEPPEPDDEDAPGLLLTGEVAKASDVRSVQLVLKDKKGKELYTTDRLTAIGAEQLEKAIEIFVKALVPEIQRPR